MSYIKNIVNTIEQNKKDDLLTIKLPHDLKIKIKQTAKDLNTDISKLIRIVMKDFINNL